ncbi:MFS transporter [Pararhizobium sp. YC-54]|uniref:MFS transporter n=1 Tax=Pararhizobium sp. YC-54 TaxID=2986920 RepID=UPI0021F6D51C|nr:MFS transporter [Pararhizobium sp. YC-54]MCW0001595.1 MFS transporter [Pararhizobium sp. YC-54]
MHAQAAAHSEPGAARNRTLQRNQWNAAQWTETYRTPTWTDYLRLDHRLSPADHELAERLAALHDGADAPGPYWRSSARQHRSAPGANRSHVSPVHEVRLI